jgi:hypothetical protein
MITDDSGPLPDLLLDIFLQMVWRRRSSESIIAPSSLRFAATAGVFMVATVASCSL